jgi:hypothetical protein
MTTKKLGIKQIAMISQYEHLVAHENVALMSSCPLYTG